MTAGTVGVALRLPMLTFTTSYFLLCSVATVGAIQIGASVGNLKGLLFFKSPYVARSLGLVLIVLAFVWFFSTGDRNINDYEGGIDANTQALFFFLGVMAGGAFTFVVSSLVNVRMTGEFRAQRTGFDSLNHSFFLRSVVQSVVYWCRNWRSQIKDYFFG